jgi:hypothetical protein
MFARAALIAFVASATARTAVAAEESAPQTPPAEAAATTPSAADAPAVHGEQGPPHGRILNGHVFMPSFTVAGALTTTSFATSLLLAYGSTTGSVQLAEKLYSGSFDYAGVGAALAYEYAFFRYFSARFTINEQVYSGIDGSSVIVVGTSLGAGGAIGATASIPVGDSLRVGVLLDYGITPGFGLTIGNGIRTVIQACRAGDCNVGDNDALFKKNNAITVQPALAANWAPWRPLGLTANVAYLSVSQHRNEGTFNGEAMSAAAAADFDFLGISTVPIGLQVTFSWTAPISGSGLQHVTDLGGGIFYTGREHLALGVQFVSRRFAVEPNVEVSWDTSLATVGLRYYW